MKNSIPFPTRPSRSNARRARMGRAWLALALVAAAGCSPGGDAPGGTSHTTLPAIDPSARSCEVLLEDDGGAVLGVEFADGVVGEHVRQAPRTALTFFAESDVPLSGAAVRIQLADSARFRIDRARCFDAAGEPLAGGGIAIDG